jgi:tetratricopeptide (TPR) repeat protein
MKQLLLLAASVFTLVANAQIKLPAPSPAQTITQDFGLGKIELTYSRPSLKGRSVFKEKSELAPLGQVWRTGANAVTKITFSNAVTIGGKPLESGSYAIYTIPGKTEWTIIINKDATLWGTQYNEAHDVFRFTVAADKLKESAETFTMQFADFKQESCELHLMWGNTAIRIPITTDVKSLLRPQVEKALEADNVSANTYMNAASFYYEWDKDLNKALANITKATDANPKGAYLFILKAKIERDLGDKVSAKADAQKAISIATDAKNDEYIQMGKDVLNSIK